MENIDELGARFADMSEVYSQCLQDVIRKCRQICGISCITNMAAGISKQELNHQSTTAWNFHSYNCHTLNVVVLNNLGQFITIIYLI